MIPCCFSCAAICVLDIPGEMSTKVSVPRTGGDQQRAGNRARYHHSHQKK